MPAVRDIAWSFESVTTDAGITVPMPAYAENDLLLALVQADTGAQTISAAGWTVVFGQSNTTYYAVLRKIATASEPSSVTFAGTVGESFNGAIVSIRDVDTTTPINVFNNVAQAAAVKYAFQTVTTTRDNCLVICAAANSSGASIPSIIEGPVTGLLGADGLAESQAIGWTVQGVLGVTPNNVTCSNIFGGAGVKAVIAINPPVSGAVVVPTYCGADASIYIDPLNGISAYNGNAAPAITADTLFTTTLNGVTAADPAISVAADVGLNSFHSTARVTSISGSLSWSGIALDLQAANLLTTASGKNILIHTGPSTPGQMQRFPGVSASKKGIGFGCLSTAGNWKAWYVHANGTGWGQQRDVPLIVNTDNASGVLGSAGTLNAAAIDAFAFWISSIGVAAQTTIWDFYSLWVLDTTTVAGGSVAEPVNIPGIVRAVADGHERRSAVLQGANQMLALQPIKFGDGAKPIYMDLDATAIEFPRIHDLAKREINYCSAPNVAGLTYHGGSGHTIKHRNSVVSSPSPYHWRIAAGAAGTYDFSGLQVIGAGDVVLRDITAPSQFTYEEMTFALCGLIAQNSAYLSNCTLNKPSGAVGLLSNNPDRFANCSFISDGTGHAVEISAAGTYNSTANTFTGYAGTDGSTGNEAVYNNSGGAVTLNIIGGTTPTIRNGAGASTTLVINPVVTTITVKDINTGVAIESARVLILASDNTGPMPFNETVTITRSGATATVVHTAHGLVSGKKVMIKGAVQQDYNGVYVLTVVDANSYTYTVANAPATPATGTIKATGVVIDGVTDVSGVVSDTRSHAANQPITGRVRRATTGTLYKTSPISGVINSLTGFSTTVQMIPDV